MDRYTLHPVPESRLQSLTVLQSTFWAQFKQRQNWKPAAFVIKDATAETEAPETGSFHTILCLVRKLPGGIEVVYIPHGPEAWIPEEPYRFLTEASRQICDYISGKPVVVRWDLPWTQNDPGDAGEESFLRRPLKKIEQEIQPRSTVILDLKPEPDCILNGMKSKTRYNVRLAARKGVVVREAGENELDRWYDLYIATAVRDRIGIHDFEYYRELFRTAGESQTRIEKGLPAGPSPRVWLFLAEHEQDLLAGIIVVAHGDTATYMYGASSDEKRNLMPGYALQWHAIQAVREYGCRWYDFFGIPPAEDADHSMHGLYRFKTGFGGSILHRWGCVDYPGRKVLYRVYRTAERARTWYYRRWRKRRRN
jgi:lipid II:glycine glycyltransferase (peptidoglycan interpeptide bridge formation enzyme)